MMTERQASSEPRRGRGRFYVKGRGEDGAMRGVMWG